MYSISSQNLQYFCRHGLTLNQMYKAVYIVHRFKILFLFPSFFNICFWTGLASNLILDSWVRHMHVHQQKTNFHSFGQKKKIFQRSTVNRVKQDLCRLALIVCPSPRVTWPGFLLHPLLILKQLVTAQLEAWEHFHEKQEFNINPHNQGNSELRLSILRPNRTHKGAC